MAVLELATTSAGARIIPLRHRQLPLEISILSSCGNHDVSRGATSSQFPGHESHLWSDMPEERLVALAQIIESWFTIWGATDTILGTASVAGKTDPTLLAVSWQAISLGQPELTLPHRADQFVQISLNKIAEETIRLNEVVA